jgi:hypothetical protein
VEECERARMWLVSPKVQKQNIDDSELTELNALAVSKA